MGKEMESWELECLIVKRTGDKALCNSSQSMDAQRSSQCYHSINTHTL